MKQHIYYKHIKCGNDCQRASCLEECYKTSCCSCYSALVVPQFCGCFWIICLELTQELWTWTEMINKEINLPPGWIWDSFFVLFAATSSFNFTLVHVQLSEDKDKQTGPSNIQLSPQFDPKSFCIYSKAGNKAQLLVNLKEFEMLIKPAANEQQVNKLWQKQLSSQREPPGRAQMSTSYKTSHQARQIFIHPVSESHQCCSAAYFHFVCSTHSELAGAAALPEVRRREWLTECRKLNSSNSNKKTFQSPQGGVCTSLPPHLL